MTLLFIFADDTARVQEPPVFVAVPDSGRPQGGARLLRPRQVPHGPEDDDGPAQVQLLLQQEALYRRHEADVLQLPGLQRPRHRVLQLRHFPGKVRQHQAEGPRPSLRSQVVATCWPPNPILNPRQPQGTPNQLALLGPLGWAFFATIDFKNMAIGSFNAKLSEKSIGNHFRAVGLMT